MHLFQLLQTLDSQIVPERCKIHLAVWNGEDDPLDVYLAGDFDNWQSWQRRRNFERPFVVSLIALERAGSWLFAGASDSLGSKWNARRGLYRYRMARRKGANELDGRLVVDFKRTGRQSYLLCENWASALRVAEIRPERLRVRDFRGYSWTMLMKKESDTVVKQSVDSWRSALSHVAGVYVVADRKTGKLYIGSATAEDGIWGRWCAYSATGHGGSRELKDLLRRRGDRYTENFQFGVLEIADSHASVNDVLNRESHWKELLLTREHGYNAN
jgi:hypothetical protein